MGNFASPSYTGKGGSPTREEIKNSEKKDVGITKILRILEKISDYQKDIEDEKDSIKAAEERIDYFNEEITNARKQLKKELSLLDDSTKSLLASAGITINVGNTLDELLDEGKSYREANKVLKNAKNLDGNR